MIAAILQTLLQATATGLIATMVMDVWALLLKHGAGLPTTDWAMVGRRIAYLPAGRFIHRPIAGSPPVRRELLIGWSAHYLIGVMYALLYIATIAVTKGTPSLVSAILFGLVTLLAPWFIMQPGMGIGMFASLAPKPNLTRAINVSMHLVFGAALYPGWLLLETISDVI
jgi:hypothetical protein